MTEKIYYQDQTQWSPEDWQTLWRYFNRLFQYIGLTDKQKAHPDHRATKIALRKIGKRDEELSSLDLDRMSTETKYLMKHMLISVGLYHLALTRFTNLSGLEEVGELTQPLVLSRNPTYVHQYYTEVGIYI